MSFPGRLKHRVQILKRENITDEDLGDFTLGASRRAEIKSLRASDEEIAGGLVGLDTVEISVRACKETRTWDTSMRLREIFGPSGLEREFEIVAPPVFDEQGRWISLRCVAGGVSSDLVDGE